MTIKTDLVCVPCVLRHVLETVKKVSDNEEIQEKVLRKALEKILEIDWEKSPIDITNMLYSEIRKITGVEDPYRELKRINNIESMRLVKKVVKEIEDSVDNEEKLKKATLAAIAGNIIDFGPTGEFSVKETLERIMKMEMKANDYRALAERIRTADTLLYFADNAGEIAFDKLYLETMLSVRKRPFSKINFVIKGGPSINDAMLEDANTVGLDKLTNIEFLLIGNGETGTGPDRDSPEVRRWIEENELVISKGQANYEGMSDIGGIFFLLIAKCSHLAELLGVKRQNIVVKHSSY